MCVRVCDALHPSQKNSNARTIYLRVLNIFCYVLEMRYKEAEEIIRQYPNFDVASAHMFVKLTEPIRKKRVYFLKVWHIV